MALHPPQNLPIVRPPLLAYLTALCCASTAHAASLSDPFGELAAIPSLHDTGRACPESIPERSLNLVDIVDTALCRNPQTASAWAAARSSAAAVGTARSAYLPTLSASGSVSRELNGETSGGGPIGGGVTDNDRDEGSDYSSSASVSLDYLLFDFGGRSADLDGARALLAAAKATRNATLQSVYLAAVSAYYDWASASGALDAAREAERAAQASLDAATARERAGTATRADRLQAQTALAQSQLIRVQAEGALRTSLGSLANSMGLQANTKLVLAAAPVVEPAADYQVQVDSLVASALEARPDLAAAQANVTAAETDIRSARADGLPRLSASAGESYSDSGDSSRDSGSVGLNLSIPLFSGYSTTYRIRSAEAGLESRKAELERLRQQVSLDVYQAHSDLVTQTQSVFTSRSLLASAEESERVARGRYEAGVGIIVDLINAQSATADARRGLVQSRSAWAAARTRLAQSLGVLEPATDPSQFTRDTASP
ncbi:MAG: TolC family protein [Panacagrimonas sp.]